MGLGAGNGFSDPDGSEAFCCLSQCRPSRSIGHRACSSTWQFQTLSGLSLLAIIERYLSLSLRPVIPGMADQIGSVKYPEAPPSVPVP